MEHIRTSYLKLQGEVDPLRAGRRIDSERATERPAQEASKVEKLRQELEESRRKAEGLGEALPERDRATTSKSTRLRNSGRLKSSSRLLMLLSRIRSSSLTTYSLLE
ncbi:uncharacterized protein A4U43_C01F11480 [Asparagus officinalis]|uniref:Uncharacterized protein n=1 Tax=Asparagus officinalis TaxID=4686 RepID=A0A5P1FQ92_ASPOF|nr:uncharacterized protein A4U43_C01F11480 [Asparagus officinalis]